MERGFHKPGDAENRLGHYVGHARHVGRPIGILVREVSMPIVTIQVTREGSGPGRNAVTAEERPP